MDEENSSGITSVDDSSSRTVEELIEANSLLTEENQALKERIDEAESSIVSLNAEIELLNKRIRELEDDKKTNEVEIERLNVISEKYESFVNEFQQFAGRMQSKVYSVGGERFYLPEQNDVLADLKRVNSYILTNSLIMSKVFYSDLSSADRDKFVSLLTVRLSLITPDVIKQVRDDKEDEVLSVLNRVGLLCNEVEQKTKDDLKSLSNTSDKIQEVSAQGLTKLKNLLNNLDKEYEKSVDVIDACSNLVQEKNDDVIKKVSSIVESLNSSYSIAETVLQSIGDVSESNSDAEDSIKQLLLKFSELYGKMKTVEGALENDHQALVESKNQLDSLNETYDGQNENFERLNSRANEIVIQHNKVVNEFLDKLPTYFKILSDSIVDVKAYVTSSIKSWLSAAQQSADSQINLGQSIDSLWENFAEASATVESFNKSLEIIAKLTNNLGDIYALYDNISGRIPSMTKLSELLDKMVKLSEQSVNTEKVQTALDGVRTGLQVYDKFGPKKGVF